MRGRVETKGGNTSEVTEESLKQQHQELDKLKALLELKERKFERDLAEFNNMTGGSRPLQFGRGQLFGDGEG